MNLAFCFNRRMIANHAYPPYDYLISDEVVNLFTLPDHNKVSVHNRDNWLYELNPPDQPPTPETPQDYQIYDDIMSDMGDPETPPGYYENVNMAEAHAAPETTTKDYTDNLNKISTTLNTYQTNINGLKDEIKSMRLEIMGLTDITVEQFYHIHNSLEEIKAKLG